MTARARKSGRKSGHGKFRRGPDARRGKGPAPGAPNAGRPPNALLAACQAVVLGELPRLTTYVAKHGPADVGYRWALDRLLERGWGKPMQPLSGPEGGPVSFTLHFGDDDDRAALRTD